MNISNYKNAEEKKHMVNKYLEYLALKSHNYANISKAMSEQQYAKTLGISEVKKPERPKDEVLRDEIAQREIALKNLQSILDITESRNALQFLSKLNEVVEFNSYFDGFSKFIEGQTNLTANIFRALWENYKKKLLSEGKYERRLELYPELAGVAEAIPQFEHLELPAEYEKAPAIGIDPEQEAKDEIDFLVNELKFTSEDDLNEAFQYFDATELLPQIRDMAYTSFIDQMKDEKLSKSDIEDVKKVIKTKGLPYAIYYNKVGVESKKMEKKSKDQPYLNEIDYITQVLGLDEKEISDSIEAKDAKKVNTTLRERYFAYLMDEYEPYGIPKEAIRKAATHKKVIPVSNEIEEIKKHIIELFRDGKLDGVELTEIEKAQVNEIYRFVKDANPSITDFKIYEGIKEDGIQPIIDAIDAEKAKQTAKKIYKPLTAEEMQQFKERSAMRKKGLPTEYLLSRPKLPQRRPKTIEKKKSPEQEAFEQYYPWMKGQPLQYPEEEQGYTLYTPTGSRKSSIGFVESKEIPSFSIPEEYKGQVKREKVPTPKFITGATRIPATEVMEVKSPILTPLPTERPPIPLPKYEPFISTKGELPKSMFQTFQTFFQPPSEVKNPFAVKSPSPTKPLSPTESVATTATEWYHELPSIGYEIPRDKDAQEILIKDLKKQVDDAIAAKQIKTTFTEEELRLSDKTGKQSYRTFYPKLQSNEDKISFLSKMLMYNETENFKKTGKSQAARLAALKSQTETSEVKETTPKVGSGFRRRAKRQKKRSRPIYWQ